MINKIKKFFVVLCVFVISLCLSCDFTNKKTDSFNYSIVPGRKDLLSADIDIKGKLIYVNITLKTGKHTDSEAICQTSLDALTEDEKKFYDIQYIVSNKDKNIEENFPVMGYIKAGNSVIKWTNYISR